MESAAGRVPVVAATGHEGTRVAAELSREAASLGADAIMLLPPSLGKPRLPDLVDHFVAVAKDVSLPVIIQDSPQVTGLPLSPTLVAKMAGHAPNIRYIKIESVPAGSAISTAKEVLGARMDVIAGWEDGRSWMRWSAAPVDACRAPISRRGWLRYIRRLGPGMELAPTRYLTGCCRC